MRHFFVKNQITFINTGLAILFLTVILLVVAPGVKKIKNLKNQINEQRESLEELYARGQNLKKTRQNYETVKENFAEISDVFVTQGQELEFITTLETLAEKNNLSLKIELNPERSRQISPQLKALPIRLLLNGQYEATLNFLDQLEQERLYVNLSQLNMSQTTLSGQGRVSLLGNRVITDQNASSQLSSVTLEGEIFIKPATRP